MQNSNGHLADKVTRLKNIAESWFIARTDPRTVSCELLCLFWPSGARENVHFTIMVAVISRAIVGWSFWPTGYLNEEKYFTVR